ncbi:hypothetical protein MIR68_008012 [Amoeboaphelidium protococcarum]|nr:hypothetical protein MIR68_008012 [Amoeboaphelidium protococcarum]
MVAGKIWKRIVRKSRQILAPLISRPSSPVGESIELSESTSRRKRRLSQEDDDEFKPDSLPTSPERDHLSSGTKVKISTQLNKKLRFARSSAQPLVVGTSARRTSLPSANPLQLSTESQTGMDLRSKSAPASKQTSPVDEEQTSGLNKRLRRRKSGYSSVSYSQAKANHKGC